MATYLQADDDASSCLRFLPKKNFEWVERVAFSAKNFSAQIDFFGRRKHEKKTLEKECESGHEVRIGQNANETALRGQALRITRAHNGQGE